MKICCIGAGYVGGPTMAIIAKWCPKILVNVVDINAKKIEAWNSEKLPVYEKGLNDIINKVRNKNLFFSTEVNYHIKNSDIIFLCVNTPTKKYGVGKNKALDISFIENAVRNIGEVCKNVKQKKIIVEKSTVPIRTGEIIKKIISLYGNEEKFQILSNPEFLSEGNAVAELENPDRVLIGGEQSKFGKKAIEILCSIYKHWVPEKNIITTDLWSSELTKLTANAFLAQRISSINSISELCEFTGANINEISKCIGADKRIGKYFLQSSVGFGGSCFQKDIYSLIYIAESYGLYEVANYWSKVIEMNEHQKNRFFKMIVNNLFNSLCNKKISILGFSFKKDTNDTRESPAIYIVKKLLEENARISIYDPKVSKNDIKNSLGVFDDQNLEICDDPYDTANESNAIVILTEWDLFKELDYCKFYEKMIKPAYLFDGRNILNFNQISKIGFLYKSIGVKN